MKTLAGYLNKKDDRIDEAISKGVIDMAEVQKQMRTIIAYFNEHALNLAERQVKNVKKYLETANDQHVKQVVEDWMKKKGFWYATEVKPGSDDWWDLFAFILKKVYKYDTPLWYEIIEPDETWEDNEWKKCREMAKKIGGFK